MEQQLTQPEIWGDPEQVKKIQKQRARLRSSIASVDRLATLLDDARTFLELAHEGEQVEPDLVSAVDELEQRTAGVETTTLFRGQHDAADAIVDLHPGAWTDNPKG